MERRFPEVRPVAPRPRRRWLIAILPLALVAAVVGAGAGYLALMGRDPVRDAHALLNPPFGGKEKVNILLIGVDSERDPRRSDTLLLGALDLSTHYAAMLSVPRDLRVEIPGHGMQKINSAYALGGVDLVKQTMIERFGVPVDYTVKVTIPALVQVVDAMGGIDVNVDRRMVYRDRSQHLDINLKPGPQHLNGYQAMGYVRFRHDTLGDLTRIQRQQNFVRQLATQVTAPNQWRHLPKLIDIALKNVDTDLTVKDLMELAQFARGADPGSIKTATLPGTPLDVHGISYLDPDWTAIASTVRQVLYHEGALVEVLHTPGLQLAGRQVARDLEADGFRIARVAEAPQAIERTAVICHRDQSDDANRIRRLLQCDTAAAPPTATRADTDITVLVGSDYSRLRGQHKRS